MKSNGVSDSTGDERATAADLLKSREPDDKVGNIKALTAAGWKPEDAQRQAIQFQHSAAKRGRFEMPTLASTVKPVAIDWLWQGYAPLGALSLLYGPEGDGKSTFTAMLAAMVTLGTLEGHLKGTPASVEIVAYEDDPGAVLVPRLVAAGADLDRVYLHGDGAGDGLLTLPDDVEAFGAAVESRGSRLVIVDPLPDALRDGLKDNNNGDVRRGIVPLHRWAQRAGVAVLGISHPNKGATDAANKVMGSKAWRSVPRSVMLYGRDPDDLEGPTRICAVSKANYSEKRATRVKVESVQVPGVEGTQPCAELAGSTEYRDADVLLANQGASDGRPIRGRGGQQADAEKLIYRLLEDGGGQVEAKVAYVAGEAAGIGEATMRRAKTAVGVTSPRRGVWEREGLPL